MKIYYRYATILLTYLFLTACSPINSAHPFDQEQAAIWIKSNTLQRPTQQHVSTRSRYTAKSA